MPKAKRRPRFLRRCLQIGIPLALLSPAMPAFPQGSSNAIGGLQLDTSQLTTAAPLAMAGTVFTVAPSTKAFPSGHCLTTDKPKTLPLVAVCFDSNTGQIVPNCSVQIDVKPVDFSGGHLHTDPGRPAGDFQPSSGISGADGLLFTTYTAPEISGIVDVTISGQCPTVTCAPFTTSIIIDQGGLSAVPVSGPGYTIQASTGHGFNDLFANPSVGSNLQQLPVEFDSLVTALINAGSLPPQNIPNLVYKSLSLPQGGLFDVDTKGRGVIDNPWHPPHCGHREGMEADLGIMNVPAEMRPALIQAIADEHFTTPVVAESPLTADANHWHLRANLKAR